MKYIRRRISTRQACRWRRSVTASDWHRRLSAARCSKPDISCDRGAVGAAPPQRALMRERGLVLSSPFTMATEQCSVRIRLNALGILAVDRVEGGPSCLASLLLNLEPLEVSQPLQLKRYGSC